MQPCWPTHIEVVLLQHSMRLHASILIGSAHHGESELMWHWESGLLLLLLLLLLLHSSSRGLYDEAPHANYQLTVSTHDDMSLDLHRRTPQQGCPRLQKKAATARHKSQVFGGSQFFCPSAEQLNVLLAK